MGAGTIGGVGGMKWVLRSKTFLAGRASHDSLSLRYRPAPGRYRPTLINPVSGQKRFRNTTTSETFIGWLDSQRYLQSNGPYNPNMVRADSLLETPLSNGTLQFEFIAPAPVNSPGPYIG